MSDRRVVEYVIEEKLPEEPAYRPWWITMSRVVFVLFSIVAIAVFGYGLARNLAERVGTVDVAPELIAGLEVTVEIPAGSTARRIAEILVDENVIADGGAFENDVRKAGSAGRLQAGSYEMMTGSSHEDLIDQLVSGPPILETFRLTVIEGLRIEEMLESLAEETGFSVGDFESALLKGEVNSIYLPSDLPDTLGLLAAWEGLLAPDTYEFTIEATPGLILQRMADTLAARVSRLDWSQLAELDLTPYDGLIIASLIEKEAMLEKDRANVSSTIYNRLVIGQRLQLDVTVVYALGSTPDRVLLSHLEIDSPYNTYLIDRLPPTPISGVRVSSLESAAAPADTGYYYFVLSDTDGSLGFSETLEEHNEKVAQARADGVFP